MGARVDIDQLRLLDELQDTSQLYELYTGHAIYLGPRVIGERTIYLFEDDTAYYTLEAAVEHMRELMRDVQY